jgi:hypothetical protein
MTTPGGDHARIPVLLIHAPSAGRTAAMLPIPEAVAAPDKRCASAGVLDS